MRGFRKLALLFNVVALMLVCMGTVRVQAAFERSLRTFYDAEIPGMRIRTDAAEYVNVGDNLTIEFSLTTDTNVFVEHFAFTVYGFINGSVKTALDDIVEIGLQLNSSVKAYNRTFTIPQLVWGVTYGETQITYSARIMGTDLMFRNITIGFVMTKVENSLLADLEGQVQNLSNSYHQLMELYLNLSNNYEQLNNTYWELQGNYTSIQSGLGELDNTRRLITILGVTTAFFVITTIYLVIKKPKQPW